MILIVGATGRLGGAVARSLLAEGKSVRATSRTLSSLDALKRLGAEPFALDLRDPGAVKSAVDGVDAIVYAAQAFISTGKGNDPRHTDDAGARSLIAAAKEAGVKHFVFASAYGASPDHPMELLRIKYAIEQVLAGSGMAYTSLRATPFMEFWASLVGDPIVKTGKTTIFGRGRNPVSFVAFADVARMAVMALDEPADRTGIFDAGGPEALTLLEVAALYERLTGKEAKKSHVPLPMMRVMTVLMRPFNPVLSRQISGGIDMDTGKYVVDMRDTLRAFPIELTTLETVVRRQVAPAQQERAYL